MNSYPQVFLGILAIILSSIISLYVYRNGKPTCNHYVANTYLYLALSVCIAALSILSLKSINMNFGILVLLIFIVLFAFIFTPAKNIILTHILWVALIVLLAICIKPIVLNNKTAILRAVLMVTLIFVITTLIGFSYFDKLHKWSHKIGLSLLIALVTIIVYELILIFAFKQYSHAQRRIVDIIVIILFTLFLIYDTVEMQKRAQLCSLSSKIHYPNYPLESYNFFIDLINIFARALGN